MSWQGYRLSVVVAASSSLFGCVLQGDRHEDRLMNEVCALAEEAARVIECEKPVEYTKSISKPDPEDPTETVTVTVPAEVSEQGKALEPAPTAVVPSWRLKFDCVVEQTRVRNLCGPELQAVNECVLDGLEQSLRNAKDSAAEGETKAEIRKAAFEDVFQCQVAIASFGDPGQVDENGADLQITRTTYPGDVLIKDDLRADNSENEPGDLECVSEFTDLAACTRGP